MGRSFWVFVLIFIFCPGALSAQVNITARVGSTAVLPCNCRNETKAQSPSQSPYVEWRTSSRTVFERQGEEVYQSEGYKGRVDVPEDQLLKGNCSLVLKNVRAEDEGDYKSSLLVKRIKRDLQPVNLQSVKLSVDETTETNDNQRSDSSDGRWSPRERGVIVAVISLVSLGAAVFILFRRRGKNGRGERMGDEESDNQPDSQNPQLQPLAPGGR